MSVPGESIGSHIRRIRTLQQRTLQDVADECGFTKSLLSKIEHGRVVPPIATLVKIAESLNITIAALMAEGDSLGSVFIPAKQEGITPVPTESGYSIVPLAVELKNKKMQPFLFIVRPEELNDKIHSHVGEEFIYILEGVMEFQVGSNIYTMHPGDSIFFDSLREHHIISVLSDQVKYLNIFN
jgi:transcriptional regulator with XRE-family HTH domain